MKIKIAIAEDHVVLRQGLISLIKDCDQDVRVIFDAGNGQELLEKLKFNSPDIILLDIDMPVMNGSQTLKQLSMFYPEVKVIMLSMHYDEGYIAEFVSKGARAYLPKGASIEKILEVIETVYTNGYYSEDGPVPSKSETLATYFTTVNSKSKFGLTSRELEIIDLLQKNKTTSEIADILKISQRTVEGHRTHIMAKTGSNNLAALITSVFRFRLS